VTRGSVHIGLPADAPIPDKTERCAILHIASINVVEAAA
jgi:hypothetical protein